MSSWMPEELYAPGEEPPFDTPKIKTCETCWCQVEELNWDNHIE